MRKLEPLWRALGRAPALSGVSAFWRELVGPDFGALRPFLRALPELATTYPCPTPGPDGCPRGIVAHAADDIVAVCRARPRACETLALKRADIVAYELDLAKLGTRLRVMLELAGDGAPIPAGEHTRTLYFGAYQPVEGSAFPAYLTLASDAEEVQSVVDDLLRRETRAFILLVPAVDSLAPDCLEVLAARGSIALALADITGVDDRGQLALARPADVLLAPFREAVMLEAARGTGNGMVFFRTPAGATWEQVEIRFKDSHTVRVRVLDAHGVFHYAQMGMANGKNSKPTRQWELLEAFAEARGTLTWKSPHADRKNQKRRELLAKDLRAFFRIDGDPMPLTADGGGWRARFTTRVDE